MKKLVCLALTLGTLSCAHNLDSEVKVYRSKAQNLTNSIKGKQKFSQIKKDSEDLISTAKVLMSSLKTKWPQCSSYFDKVVADAEKMSSLTLAQIEKDYHEGEALPEAEDECFNAKELIVHPATVIVLTRSKDNKKTREKMEDEIIEVLEHLGLILTEQD